MITRDIKNICATIAFMFTLNCVSATPHIIKWYFALWVVYLVSLWLSEEQHDEP